MLRSLSLKGQNERGICFQEALEICARGIAKEKKVEMILSEVRAYLENSYRTEWFLFSWQKKKIIQKDFDLIERFLESVYLKELVSGGRTVFQADFTVNVPISLCCNEITVTHINGRADLLVQHGNGGITGIILCRKFTRPYSYCARKEENKVMGSVEMLVLLKGLREAFPDRAVRVLSLIHI